MQCSNCGFGIDPTNESQPVCPACGVPVASGDPDDFEQIEFEALTGLSDAGAELEGAKYDNGWKPKSFWPNTKQWVN
jgi:rubredoxin